MTNRKRRDNTIAANINTADLIEPNNNGIRATVMYVGEHPNCVEPHVLIRFAYPNDFSVNANFRGQTSSKIYRLDDSVTRWLSPKVAAR